MTYLVLENCIKVLNFDHLAVISYLDFKIFVIIKTATKPFQRLPQIWSFLVLSILQDSDIAIDGRVWSIIEGLKKHETKSNHLDQSPSPSVM